MRIEIEREDDGRWITEVPDLAGVLAYGQTRDDAVSKAQALALRVIAEGDVRAAGHVLDRIETRAASLNRMPLRGRIVPELAAFGIQVYRELIIPPWRVFYRVSGHTVYVLGVFDGRRNLEDVLLERLVRA